MMLEKITIREVLDYHRKNGWRYGSTFPEYKHVLLVESLEPPHGTREAVNQTLDIISWLVKNVGEIESDNWKIDIVPHNKLMEVYFKKHQDMLAFKLKWC